MERPAASICAGISPTSSQETTHRAPLIRWPHYSMMAGMYFVPQARTQARNAYLHYASHALSEPGEELAGRGRWTMDVGRWSLDAGDGAEWLVDITASARLIGGVEVKVKRMQEAGLSTRGDPRARSRPANHRARMPSPQDSSSRLQPPASNHPTPKRQGRPGCDNNAAVHDGNGAGPAIAGPGDVSAKHARQP
ncbi:hypothetical protein G7046_g8199 [Stylonectria norvegica]|nr:hypothetical protein G7046_g8199 [Stylonectria norvegica]